MFCESGGCFPLGTLTRSGVRPLFLMERHRNRGFVVSTKTQLSTPAPMRFVTFLNAIHRFKSFVFEETFLTDKDQTLIVKVRPRANGKPVCSGCGSKRPTYDQTNERLFEHVPLWNIRVFFQYTMRRVRCPRCGVRTEAVPWAEGKQRMTRDFRTFLSIWARRLSWAEVATCFRTSWDTVFRAVKSSVEWGLAHRPLDDIVSIGVDEIHIGKGQHYMTLVYQIDAHARRLLAVRPGRKAKSLMRCLRDIGSQAYADIQFVCSDMWKAYRKVIQKRLPQAIHVLDKFHIVANLHKALDEVRRQEVAQLRKEKGGSILKNSRYCLLKNPENLTPGQDLKLNDVLSYKLKTSRAYFLKESFRVLWSYQSLHWARWYWKKWCGRAMRSRLEPIKKFVRMLRRHEDLIFNYWRAKKAFTSGAVEGLNRKVNLVTRRAYGFRSEEVYRIALFHALGDLPDPPSAHRFC